MGGKLFLTIGICILLISLVGASIEHTKTTDIICNGNICTKTLYSGVRNVYEDDTWKRVEEARSLKGSGVEVVVLEDDEDYPVEVVDFNYTSIKVKLNPKGIKIFNEDIPVRIWTQNNTKAMEFNKDVADGKKVSKGVEDYKEKMDKVVEDNIGFNLLNQEEEKVYKFGMGKILEFGKESTTIILQDNETENLADLIATDPNDIYEGQIKFNVLSVLNSDVFNISLVNLNLSIMETISYWHDAFNMTFWILPNQSWEDTCVNESSPRTNSPKEINEWNNWTATLINQTNFTVPSFSQSIGSSLSFDITNLFSQEYSKSLNNFSIRMGMSEFVVVSPVDTVGGDYIFDFLIGNYSGGSFDHLISFVSKEYTTDILRRPKLTITYNTYMRINSPLDGSSHPSTPDINITTEVNMDVCYWSNNSGVNNYSMENTSATEWFNITATLPEGSNTLVFYCNQTSDGTWRTSETTTFTIGTTPPNITINSPTNRTYNSNTILFNITATDETSMDTCIYSLTAGTLNYTMTNAGDEWTDTNSTMAQGGHTAYFYCNDSSNNLNNTETISFNIDSINPDISILSPDGSTNTTDSQIEINYSVSDTNLQSCWWTNSSGAYNTSITCGENITSLTWAEGANTISIHVNDSANNVNSSSVTFNLDSTYPIVSILYPENVTYDVNVTVINYSLTETNPDSCWYSNNSGSINSTFVSAGTNFTGVVSGTGSNTWTVYCNDTFGLTNSTSVTFERIEDPTSPEVTINTPINKIYNNGSMLFNITATDNKAMDSCWYSLDSGQENVSLTEGGSDYTNRNSSMLRGEYTVKYFCNDSSNNINNTESVSFEIRWGGTLNASLNLNENSGTTAHETTSSGSGSVSGASWKDDDTEITLTENTHYSTSGNEFTIIDSTLSYTNLSLLLGYGEAKLIKSYANETMVGVGEFSGYFDLIILGIVITVILGIIIAFIGNRRVN